MKKSQFQTPENIQTANPLVGHVTPCAPFPASQTPVRPE